VSDASDPGEPDGEETAAEHGVAGTQRGDSRMEEEPVDPESPDVADWGRATETGGEATSSD
jgi:hypothetical protein